MIEVVSYPEPNVIGYVPADLLNAVPFRPGTEIANTDEPPFVAVGRFMIDCAREAGIDIPYPKEVSAIAKTLRPGNQGHSPSFHRDVKKNFLSTASVLNTEYLVGTCSSEQINNATASLDDPKLSTDWMPPGKLIEHLFLKYDDHEVLDFLPGLTIVYLQAGAVTLEARGRHSKHRSPVNRTDTAVDRTFFAVEFSKRKHIPAELLLVTASSSN